MEEFKSSGLDHLAVATKVHLNIKLVTTLRV